VNVTIKRYVYRIKIALLTVSHHFLIFVRSLLRLQMLS